MLIDPIIAPEQLGELTDLVLFDVRTGPGARRSYSEGHLPGAVFADLETELSGPKLDAARGGRHPLPDPALFAAQLARWGVGPDAHVVAYDDQNGANAAARLWWMLRALGHTRVQVLDGGLQAALAAGVTLSRELPAERADVAAYASADWRLPTASLREVDAARGRSEALVLDVRAAARYLGQTEPIDPIAGHIPGARNLPFSENLADDGRFKAPAELAQQYQLVLQGREPSQLIVHCGSGVTACHTLLALERAALPGARLYVGSWGEWCRNPDRPRIP